MAYTTNSALDSLLYIRNGSSTARWNFSDAVGSSVSSPSGIGNHAQITYSFLTASPSFDTVIGFSSFSTDQSNATRLILNSLEKIIDIDFVEVSGVGQITFGNSNQSESQGGYASPASYSYSYSAGKIVSVSEQDAAGDIWINNKVTWGSSAWTSREDGYETLLHEIGHALGLKHPFEASANGYLLDDSLDSERYTVMSYTDSANATLVSVEGTASSYSWTEYALKPSTFSIMDIEALQYLYGVSKTVNESNTTYQWVKNPEIIECIWDSGGVDTIDCSNQIYRCEINLNAGTFSSVSLRQTDSEKRSGLDLPSWFNQPLPSDVYDASNNVSIAKNVVIENAQGGSASDSLTGNVTANSLCGNAGADFLSGNAGNDTLQGGRGNDQIDGGAGSDTADYSDKTLSVKVVLDTSKYVTVYINGVTEDTIKNIENLSGGSGSDQLCGDALANKLMGNAGADVLKGQGGSDFLHGGFGSDSLYGGVDKVKDIFDFNAIAESKVGTARDKIFDFISGTDKLDLSGIDANLTNTKTGDQAFLFNNTTAQANSVWYKVMEVDGNMATNDIVIYGDVDGNTSADFEVGIVGVAKLAQVDFVL